MDEKQRTIKAPMPSESATEVIQMVFPDDTNTLGTLRGGRLMHWIDLAGAIAAKRHCNRSVVTASMDRLDFLHPVHIGDLVVLNAQVNRACRTSMEVGVRVYKENFRTGERTKTASAYLTYIAFDETRKPTTVPPIDPETEDEKRCFEKAAERRAIRIANKGRD